MEVSEVDCGCTRRAGRAECFKKGGAENIPVVAIEAGTFEGVEPFQGVPTEGVEDEGHRLFGGPVRGCAGSVDTLHPLFGGELVLSVTGVNGELREVTLTEVFDVVVDTIGHGEDGVSELVERRSSGGGGGGGGGFEVSKTLK